MDDSVSGAAGASSAGSASDASSASAGSNDARGGQIPPGPVAPTAPAAPVKPAAKERELTAGITAKEAGSPSPKAAEGESAEDEYWERFAREIELEKKVEELGGIEKVESGEVKLPPEVAKEMGVEPAVTIDTPLEKATGLSIRGVSLTDDQLTTGKKKPVNFSLRWLVEWFILELLKARFIVRFVQGKILRVKE